MATIETSKIPFDLVLLQNEYSASLRQAPITNQPFPQAFKSANPAFQTTPNGSIFIDAIAVDNVNNLLAQLQALGLQNFAVAGRIISGAIPINALSQAATLSSLKFLNPAYKPIVNVGLTTTQGDVAAKANLARTNLGLTGVGTTVGVLSDSFATKVLPSTTATQDVTNGDLPGIGNPNGFLTPVNVLDDSGSSASDEGRAMLQIVHDLAPGASLAFHTAFTGIANFAQGIIDLKNAGSTVIVDDVFYLNEPFFQDGEIAKAVEIVVAAGVSYFSSAGNQARQSYQSAFTSATVFTNGQLPISVASGNTNPSAFFGGTAHDFDPSAGVDVYQKFTLGSGQRIRLSFQWADPFFSTNGSSGSTRDLDVYILNAGLTTVVGGQATNSLGRDALEVVDFTNSTGASADFNLLILQRSIGSQTPPSLIKYINYGNAVSGLEYDTQSYTIVGHANAAGAAAVGAAFYGFTPAFGQTPPLLETFSSVGTTSPSILFTNSGVSTSIVRQKPDFVAPDGGNTSFFGQDISFGTTDPDTFPNFFGTSASAPHAAAIAALIQQAIPSATPSQIYSSLKNTAINMDIAGYDVNTGFGLIDAQAAINSLPRNQITGTVNRDNLNGTNGLDIITGGSGADTLAGGLAQDTFVYSSARDAGDLISGFQTGIDRLDFRGLATSLGQTGVNLISNNYLSFIANGTDTRVLLDNDGAGAGFVPRPYILVQNITPASLNVASNFIFQ